MAQTLSHSEIRNDDVADLMDDVADLLDVQHADRYRVQAWRAGASAVRSLGEPVDAVLERGGSRALVALPHIGRSLAKAIEEVVHTGRLGLRDRLEGEVSPEDLFCTVPGIGEGLAHRIHEQLHIETLEELEAAAHDGRLETVSGVGPRRVRAIRDVLGARLVRSARRRARRSRAPGAATAPLPPVQLLLEVDRSYRERAAAGILPAIAPRRFNPEGRSWLPIMHMSRSGWDLTALYSNTARAHQLGRTRDWVVIFYERDGVEDQCTVVTEHLGPLAGCRVVRGREAECQSHHDGGDAAPPRPAERR